jgi:hypothetical protein
MCLNCVKRLRQPSFRCQKGVAKGQVGGLTGVAIEGTILNERSLILPCPHFHHAS